MARPRKNNAEYFSHDSDMRNNKKILAVRAKYGIEGYSVYCMLLETVCSSDFFKIKNDDITLLLISGDFRIDIEKLKEIINFFLSINLLQKTDDNHLTCNQLAERLQYLINKREEERLKYIKLNKSKVKESKRNSQKLTSNSQKSAETQVSVAETIYIHWQSKNIIKHNKITDDIKRAVKGSLLNGHSVEDILNAINNYSKIINSTAHYFNYKWTLKDFLKRGLEKFLNNADPLNNFKKDDFSKKPEPKNQYSEVTVTQG